MVTDPQSAEVVEDNFYTLLQGDDNTNTALRDVPNPIDDDDVEIPPPSHEEVKVAVMRFKNNKVAGSDGLPAELFKTGCNELVGRAHAPAYLQNMARGKYAQRLFSVLS